MSGSDEAAILEADGRPATHEQWRTLVDKVLKGADFERRLVSKTKDDLTIEPLYAAARGRETRALRGKAGPWHIVQRVDHPDPVEANRLVLAELAGGADGLALTFAEAPTARGFGIAAPNLAALNRVLDGVRLDLARLRLEAAPFAGPALARMMAAVVERRGVAPGTVAIDFGLDPIGDLARAGTSPRAWTALAEEAADTAADLAERGFRGAILRADGRAVHEAGGSEAQELAFATAAGIAYLRALETAGRPLEAAREALSFLLVADADEFLTIAKFRAMRRLWARVEEACALEPRPIQLAAETAWRMASRRDPWVNMLRATVATFAAGVGGADAVTVLPFTAALGLADDFARRIARNTQLILIEEANVGRVADPAAGAGGFEALTEALAERAWALVREIEAAGGLVRSLIEGRLQARIGVVRAARDEAIAHRRDALTGTSEFPDLAEAPVAVLVPSSAGLAPAPTSAGAALAIAPLPSRRDAEAFERWRDASDARFATTGSRPRIFLATLGPAAAFTARAIFARNFFEAGGIETVSDGGLASLDAMVEAFRASGAAVACLCSTDAVYAAEAIPAATALTQAGARRVYLAGAPKDLRRALEEEAGVGPFVYSGCDALETFRDVYNLLSH